VNDIQTALLNVALHLHQDLSVLCYKTVLSSSSNLDVGCPARRMQQQLPPHQRRRQWRHRGSWCSGSAALCLAGCCCCCPRVVLVGSGQKSHQVALQGGIGQGKKTGSVGQTLGSRAGPEKGRATLACTACITPPQLRAEKLQRVTCTLACTPGPPPSKHACRTADSVATSVSLPLLPGALPLPPASA